MIKTKVLAIVAAIAVGICALNAVPAALAQEPVFLDVDTATPVGAAIEYIVSLGAIDGVSPDRFDPDAPISAIDYIVMLCRLRGLAPQSDKDGIALSGYMESALQAHWYDWDEIPPDNPAGFSNPLKREIAANILVNAFFGDVQYDWSEHDKISDFSDVGGRYYKGVLGGLTLGLFDHKSGTPFYPSRPLSRADACLWASNALKKADIGPIQSSAPEATPAPVPSAAPVVPADGGVSEHGWLQVIGTQLCDEKGAPVVLRGMSSMGIQWYPQYTSRQCIQNTVDRGANVFRIAMYIEEGGYLSDPPCFTALVEQIVENAVQCDVYVVIDWHILSDGNPMKHADEAVRFFSEMSAKYSDTPNVIYEICNEPNGDVTWARDVKPYAERVVSAIRANSPDSIILAGSPTWSQDVDIAAADPLSGSNIMYTLHFYAGTHGDQLMEKAKRAVELGAPVFVSEWGTSAADGNGGVYLDSSRRWLQFLDNNNISWCNWSLCDKNESSAALVPGAPSDTTWTDADLTESGRYVFSQFGKSNVPAARPEAVPVTAADAAQEFGSEPGRTTLIRSGSAIVEPDDIVCTGYIAERVDNLTGDVTGTATVVVYGDVLGTGTITLSQLVRMTKALTQVQPLYGPFAEAADLDGSGTIGISDLVLEAGLYTSGGVLRCGFTTNG